MMRYIMTNTPKMNMASKIIFKKPADLVPYEFNNKIHQPKQIDLIANSISEMGFQNPILIDGNNIIIAGHGRLEAAKKLGMAEVPCVLVENLTKAQIKKLRILDNRLAEVHTEYDMESLQHEMTELADPELFDLFPDMVADPDALSDEFGLPDEDKGGIETITFTVHSTQAEEIRRAMVKAKEMGDFGDTGNENSNGNALARICEMFITQNT